LIQFWKLRKAELDCHAVRRLIRRFVNMHIAIIGLLLAVNLADRL
jgi:hypothetical protein